jgi:hypothetical protein
MKEDIHIRVDEELMAAVRRLAKDYGLSLAAATSWIMRLGLQQAERAAAALDESG